MIVLLRSSNRVAATILVTCVFVTIAIWTFVWPDSIDYLRQRPSSGNGSGSGSSHANTGPIANGIPLRILPLGDSITDGDKSSQGDGYRLSLLNLLHTRGSKDVHFIGSLHSGTMSGIGNDAHEGWSGRSINQINRNLQVSGTLAEGELCPNVVLLHAGTNDMINDPPIDLDPYETGPERLGALMDVVLQACPNTTMLIAKIIQATIYFAQPERIATFNSGVPAVVTKRARQGFKALMVDMSMIDGLKEDDLADGLHPNDYGYGKMAGIWVKGMEEVGRMGWIGEPERTK